MREGQKFKEIKITLEALSPKTASGYVDNYTNIIKSSTISKKQLNQGKNSFQFNYEIPYKAPFSIYGILLRRELFIHLKLDRRFKSDKHIWIPIYILPTT